MDAVQRVLLVPRWSGSAESDFYPWLSRALAARTPALGLEVAPLLPEPGRPEIEAAVGALAGRDLTRTLLVGHSVGCQVLLRHLARVATEVRVPALLCVAGWWTVDQPWDTLRPWLDTPFDAARAAARCGRIDVLLGDDDPFTADAAATKERFEAIGASVAILPGRRHFNAAEEPAVLEAILRLAG